jgi:flavin reductase ActVB
MSVDPQTFRDVLSRLAAAVNIVTAYDEDGGEIGLTVSAFTSVSLEPPLVLICLDERGQSTRAVVDHGGFTVNMLPAGADQLAMKFATTEVDRFAGEKTKEPETARAGPILVDHAIAYLECESEHRIEAGDHWIVVGHVRAAGVLREHAEPLVYFRRNFRALGLLATQ